MHTAALVVLSLLLAQPALAEAPARVRFGISTPNQNVAWDDLLAAWKEAEALGFDSAWVFDHFIPIFGNQDGPCLEGWTMLAALAAETRRLRVGVMVTGNTYRNPALLAKMATTVDQVSHGRLVLGIGAGWFERDHAAYGFAFGSPRERARKLAEGLQVITKLWSEDHPSFAGKYYQLDKAPFAPPNVQKPHPPIVIGGQGKRWIVPLVARYADGWNAVSGVTPDGIRERRAIIETECRRIGRSPARARSPCCCPWSPSPASRSRGRWCGSARARWSGKRWHSRSSPTARPPSSGASASTSTPGPPRSSSGCARRSIGGCSAVSRKTSCQL